MSGGLGALARERAGVAFIVLQHLQQVRTLAAGAAVVKGRSRIAAFLRQPVYVLAIGGVGCFEGAVQQTTDVGQGLLWRRFARA